MPVVRRGFLSSVDFELNATPWNARYSASSLRHTVLNEFGLGESLRVMLSRSWRVSIINEASTTTYLRVMQIGPGGGSFVNNIIIKGYVHIFPIHQMQPVAEG